MLKTKVWLSLLIISSMLCAACAQAAPAVAEEPAVPLSQDTLEMVPDFSYAVTPQTPYIYIDQIGYRSQDKKIVFINGMNLNKTFSVQDAENGEEVYSGTLHKVKDLDGKQLYIGDFTGITVEGEYVIRHPQLGDSYEFIVEDSVYDREFLVLQKTAKEYTYTNVSDLAYLLANLMFIKEMFPDAKVDSSFIEKNVLMLLNSWDAGSGAFYSEIFTEPIVNGQDAPGRTAEVPAGTISLTTTAQMAGILAQYSILYRKVDPDFAVQCLNVAQKAYRYIEQYKANTDTDAWYYAAVQLYRATAQYKYRSAIAEYDAVDSSLHSSSSQGYTILADFIYLLTPRGTDYARCNMLLDKYMDKAQAISVKSSRENFYVLENIDTMSDKEVLEDMIILGIVNHVLSGQEYAGVQRNYVHYLSGVNMGAHDYMSEKLITMPSQDGINITNISKLLVIFGNLCQE